ncbi:hypothetical protein IMX26_05545 [Clostridium sp. 'deep sea']|uniref:hypothetical protein n=1 Tax=Clostridium sp. 'deep sea' TaxID=2779445 RepID=UPI0018967D06|nr:hypothetical protein [Clostridium sp. 'deep sea']QOR36277.1 hypothetical protein IMX26_05545 [Clostridium sp. 'deep sea']
MSYFKVYENPNEKYDIIFSLNENKEIPEVYSDLIKEVQLINSVINKVYERNEANKNRYFKRLLRTAQAGAVGEFAKPELAVISLEGLKKEILEREGGNIKNNYMIKLGLNALALSIVFLILAFIFSNTNKNLLAYCFVWIGAMVGTWMSFAIRKMELKFEDLFSLENDKMSPLIRLIFTSITATFVLLLMKNGVINISSGSFSANSPNSNEFAFIIGAFSGLAEKKLATDLYNKSVSVLSIKNSGKDVL